MSKVKIFFLASTVIGFFFLVGCSKSNNTTVQATVYYSPWLTITMAPTDAGDTIYEGTIAASKLTQTVINTGAVLTFLGQPGYPSTNDTAAESAVDYGLYSTLVPGSIQLLSLGYLHDFTTSNSGFLYRYVIVPGTVLETTGMTKQELQSKSYAEATKLIAAAAQKASTPTVQ